MHIPVSLSQREPLYREWIEQCFVSREERRLRYEKQRRWFLFGAESGEAVSNKIGPHLETVQAFLCTRGEAAHFSLELPSPGPSQDAERLPAVARVLQTAWRQANLPILYGMAVSWGLVYDCMFIKVVPRRNGFTPYLVEPGTFGVLREDIPSLSRQEAFCHEYFITHSELRSRLADHPEGKKLLDQITQGSVRENDENSSGYEALPTSPIVYGQNFSGTIVQTGEGRGSAYSPQVSAPLVRLRDLYVRNDATHDWRLVTIADPFVILFEGALPFLPGEIPFVQVCPHPLPHYFWGASEVARMIRLQAWRNERITQIRNLMALQVDPPMALVGYRLPDEEKFALKNAGSILNVNTPGAKVQEFRPQIPPDIFQELGEIDSQFADVSGVVELFQGRAAGSKTGPQAEKLAELGSARLRRTATIIEDQLSELATVLFRVLRAYSMEPVPMELPASPFLLSDFPGDALVRVDAHSASPLFSASALSLAQTLLEAHIIDGATFLEMVNAPGLETLQARYRILQSVQAQQNAQELSLVEAGKAKETITVKK